MPELRKLFRNKCAFCESEVTDEPDEVLLAFLRPTEGAVQNSGAVDREHYCWLSWEWSNFYLACQTCIRQKGKSFPTLKDRALPGSYNEELLTEEPLCLDPCLDDPGRHLEFDKSGLVRARQGSNRGEVTIRLLDLNRDDLVRARKTQAQKIWDSLVTCLLDPLRVSREMVEPLVRGCSDHSPFAGMTRHLLLGWLEELTPKTSHPLRVILAEIKPLLSHATDDSQLASSSVDPEQTFIDSLRLYLDGAKQLMEIPIYRAFLSIDLKGSTPMKIEQSPAATDYSFAAFKVFVKEKLEQHNRLHFSWAGDGGMSSFERAQDAVDAALEVLRNIAAFNREQNRLPSAFEPRCGIDWGAVFVDKPLSETFARVADFAGHLQKEASPNGLLISEAALGQISNQDDFRLSVKKVDGKNAWEYVRPLP